MKLTYRYSLLVIAAILLVVACNTSKNQSTSASLSYFEKVQALYSQDLRQSIAHLDSLEKATQVGALKKHYLQARKYFKYAEPILSFTDVENYKFLNQPNILKVDEEDATSIKIKPPKGFQVLEEQIYADSVDLAAIQENALITKQRLKLIQGNLSFKKYKPYHFLWLLRGAIIRVALTGTTGFDSPVLENSLEESRLVYERLQDYLKIFEAKFTDPKLLNQWNEAFAKCKSTLQGDFNAFDRYAFIQQHTHPQLDLWKQTVAQWEVEFPFTLAIQHEASSLFSSSTFNIQYFADNKFGKNSQERIELGRKLFNDKGLSRDNKMSCATCHQKKLAFTDGIAKAKGQTRNSPTLLYAALQRKMFHDGRTGSLEGQIISVVNNRAEFHSSMGDIQQFVEKSPKYKAEFVKLYQRGTNEMNIRHAIASYIRSLAPFDSKFDRNINKQEQTLTQEEILGFNLFMGKAKCATCHFPPTFNGTVPPNFKETELEMLGVPEKPDTANATIDPDLGRFHLFNTAQRKFFFKTPTVRNIAKTAPYMHNGAYETLEQVMDFYNRGGGAGIGIDQPLQTLPPDPLNLTVKEQQALVAFMQSLTDLPKAQSQE